MHYSIIKNIKFTNSENKNLKFEELKQFLRKLKSMRIGSMP